jgi:7-cyano-7-deazaguanine synthase
VKVSDTAVVLVSGGMDSCVTAAIAAQTHALAFLHMNYGQRTEGRELKAFHDLADHFSVGRRLVVSMEYLQRIGGSSLTDHSLPVSGAKLDRKEIPSSYVPFRNANMLSVATSWAEVIGANAVYIGAVDEDSSGYPDCRAEFFSLFQQVIAKGTRPTTRIEVRTPIIAMSKAEIVLRGLALGAPLHLTWSCYQSEEVACGECDSCALRLRGFEIAGVDDPIPYLHRPSYANTRELP